MRTLFVKKMMSMSNKYINVSVVVVADTAAVIVQLCFNLPLHMLFIPAVVIHEYEVAGKKMSLTSFLSAFLSNACQMKYEKKGYIHFTKSSFLCSDVRHFC